MSSEKQKTIHDNTTDIILLLNNKNCKNVIKFEGNISKTAESVNQKSIRPIYGRHLNNNMVVDMLAAFYDLPFVGWKVKPDPGD